MQKLNLYPNALHGNSTTDKSFYDYLLIARQHKKENSKTPFIFEYHEKNYGFQSRYIIDALKALGTKSKTYITNEKYSKLYIESEIGAITILPMRLNVNSTIKADYAE